MFGLVKVSFAAGVGLVSGGVMLGLVEELVELPVVEVPEVVLLLELGAVLDMLEVALESLFSGYLLAELLRVLRLQPAQPMTRAIAATPRSFNFVFMDIPVMILVLLCLAAR